MKDTIELNKEEPKEAFPYKPPTEAKQKYAHVFELEGPLPTRWTKWLFDKVVALIGLAIAIPILFLVKIAYIIEGIIIPENRGYMFFSYNAISQGKLIPKYKD